jgi:hypothetical protein
MWVKKMLDDVLWGSVVGFFCEIFLAKSCLNDDGGCFEK